MRTLSCPQCKVPMQPYFVEGDVELDRCPSCVRLWFDVKELEKAAGRAFLPRLKGSDSSHECPADKVLLGTSLIRGDVAIEECPMCGGALLDAHDFELIAGKALKEVVKQKPKRAAPPPPQPKVVAFRCERCGKKTPIAEAGNVHGATVCRDCEVKPWPDQPTHYPQHTNDIGRMLEEMFDTLFD